MSTNKLEKVTEDEFFSDSSFVNTLSANELKAHIVQTRAELSANLDALEDKFNVERQMEKAKRRCQARIARMKREQPLALAAIGVGAVVVAGLIVTAVVRGTGRR